MNQEYFSAQEAADILGMSKAGLIKKAKNENWESRPRKGKGGGKEYHINSFPIEAQNIIYKQQAKAQLAEMKQNDDFKKPHRSEINFTYSPEDLAAHYERKSNKAKETAQAKLMLFRTAMKLHQQGISMRDALKMAADGSQWSFSTLRDIFYGKSGKPGLVNYEPQHWIYALVPGYTGKRESAKFSVEAWDYLKADYLRLEKPPLTACYDRLTRLAEENRWSVPSYNTVAARIKALPITTVTLLREGEHALMRLFPALERSVRDMHALEWINGDGYMHNVFVKTERGEVVRLKTWFWQDIYSRKILAYRTAETENTDTIRLSFGELVEKYGIPHHATIDNTRAAANKWMTGGVPNRYRFKVKEDDPLGLFPMLDVQVHWTSVLNGKGHGQAKPIERAFGVGGLGEYVDKHPAFAGAYTGPNPTAKPENYASKAVPIAEFTKILKQEINAWNAKAKRRTEICGGELSFDEAFQQSYSQATIRKATKEQRRLWLLSAEAITVNKDGTLVLDAGNASGLGRNRFAADALLEYRGQKIVVRFDPDNLHGSVFAYTLDGRFICEAECFEAAGFGDTQIARDHTRARKQKMRAAKDAAKAQQRMDILEAARMLPKTEEPDTPNAGAVQPMFNRTLKVSNGSEIHDWENDKNESNFIDLAKRLSAAKAQQKDKI